MQLYPSLFSLLLGKNANLKILFENMRCYSFLQESLTISLLLIGHKLQTIKNLQTRFKEHIYINHFLFAKKIPCNKLLVTLFCFYFFRFHPARFYFPFLLHTTQKSCNNMVYSHLQQCNTPSDTTLTLHDTTLEIEKRE